MSQKLLKIGEHYTVDSNSNYAKRHINVCLGGDLCSPFFSNFSEILFVKISFNVNDFLRMMNESCFLECGRFHFLLSSLTLLLLAGTAFSSYKSKASAYEYCS